MARLKRFMRSLRHASSGLRHAMREQNFQLELLAAVTAVTAAVYFRVGAWQTAVLSLVVLLVLVLEMINTIFERVIDILVPRQHPYAKVIKDMMAGAVLLACIGSVLIGIIIFLPYMWTDSGIL